MQTPESKNCIAELISAPEVGALVPRLRSLLRARPLLP
jgi:hypothetical protein